MSDPALRLVPDLQQLAGDIARAHVALQDIDRAIEGTEKKMTALREEQTKRRVTIGRLLIEAKQSIKHGGWLPYLEKLGIGEDSARRWMALAGFVETTKSSTDEDVRDLAPTLADAGIDKRPRKRAAAQNAKPPAEEPPPPKVNDIDAALMLLDRTIMKYATSWPKRSRASLVETLLAVAARIDQMQSE